MPAGLGVFGGVAVRGGIAAQRSAARLTGAEVDPARPNIHALLAAARLGMLDVGYRIDVRHRLLKPWGSPLESS